MTVMETENDTLGLTITGEEELVQELLFNKFSSKRRKPHTGLILC